MDEERRRRVAERFAMDDLPCGRAADDDVTEEAERELKEDEPIRAPEGRVY